MDLLSSGFLLLILVASGGIAFVADGLGKKLGKKRLSVFGLRPKHVASLGTVGMGMAVSFLTILFVAAVSGDAREWLLQGRRLLVQRDGFARDVEVQRGQLDGLTADINHYRSRLLGVQGELRRGGQKVKELDAKVNGLDADLKARNADLQKTKGELVLRQRSLESLQARLPLLTRQVERAEGQLAKTSALLAQAKEGLASAKIALAQTRLALGTASKNVFSANAKSDQIAKKSLETYKKAVVLEAQVKARQEEVDKLQQDTRTLVAQRESVQKELGDAQTQYAAVLARLDRAGQDLAELEAIANDQQHFLASTTRISRTEPMTFRAGEEVARVVVPSGASLRAAQDALAALLRAARVEAASRGAKGHRMSGRVLEEADLVDRRDPKTGAIIDAAALRRNVVERIVGQPDDEALVATSSLNAFGGEVVSLEIAALPNPIVYKRNEMLAEAQIDGAQTEDRILGQLRQFVGGRVRERAAQDRMIPRAMVPAPYGEVAAGDLFGVVRDVKRTGRTVRVQAFAEGETRAADPLRLEFRVK